MKTLILLISSLFLFSCSERIIIKRVTEYKTITKYKYTNNLIKCEIPKLKPAEIFKVGTSVDSLGNAYKKNKISTLSLNEKISKLKNVCSPGAPIVKEAEEIQTNTVHHKDEEIIN